MRTYQTSKEILLNGIDETIKLMDHSVERFKSGEITKSELKLFIVGLRIGVDHIFDEMIWSNTKWDE